jgi:hypothetical protein
MSIVSSSQKTVFSGLDLNSTTMLYTDAAETGADAGWHSSKYTDCVIQIGLATFTKDVAYRVEGRFASGSRAASIAVGTLSANNIDQLIAVDTSKTSQVRVGVSLGTETASPTGYPHIVHCQLLLTDRR